MSESIKSNIETNKNSFDMSNNKSEITSINTITGTSKSGSLIKSINNDLGVKTETVSLNTKSIEPIKTSLDKIIDTGKIARSASDALNGNFVDSINENYWNSGDLTYTVRDDGTVLIKRNGEAMGFTLLENIKTNIQEQTTNTEVKEDSDGPYEYGTHMKLSDIVDLNKISKSAKDVKWHTYMDVPMTDFKMAKLSYELNGDIATIMDNGIIIGYTDKSNLSMYNSVIDEDLKLSSSNDSLNSILDDVEKLRNFVGPTNPNSELKYIYTLNSIEKYRYGDYVNIYKQDDNTTVTYNMYDSDGKKIEKGLNVLMDDKITNYVDLKNINNITYEGSFINISLKNGSNVYIVDGTNSYVYGTDKDGNLNFGYYNNDGQLESISIFSEYANDNYQYGGRQYDFKTNSSDLISDPKIVEILEEYYPGTSLTDKQAFLQGINGRCCGFVGKINGLFKQYIGKEKEFRDTYGFDMYKIDNEGNIDFNYEYLILDYIGYVYSEKYNRSMSQTRSIVAHSLTEGKLFESFLSEKYNVECTMKAYMGGSVYGQNNSFGGSAGQIGHVYGTGNIASTCKSLVDDNNDVMIGAQNYTITDYETGKSYHNNGGHAMSVIGVEDGTLIVSSFGRKYKLTSANYSTIYMTNYNLEG